MTTSAERPGGGRPTIALWITMLMLVVILATAVSAR
jgi:hypothetical protein